MQVTNWISQHGAMVSVQDMVVRVGFGRIILDVVGSSEGFARQSDNAVRRALE